MYDPPGGVCPFGKWGLMDGVDSRGAIKTAGYRGAVRNFEDLALGMNIV